MVIDIIFVIFAAYGFYTGFSKGIIRTIFNILAYTFGFMAAFKFSPAMTNFLESTFNNDNPLLFIAGFLLSFFLTLVVLRTLARALEGALQTANINVLNQAAGGLLLSGIFILVFSILLWFGEQSHILNREAKEESITYAYLEGVPAQAWKIGQSLRPTFEEFWAYSVEFMDKLENMAVEKQESNDNIYDIPDEETTNN